MLKNKESGNGVLRPLRCETKKKKRKNEENKINITHGIKENKNRKRWEKKNNKPINTRDENLGCSLTSPPGSIPFPKAVMTTTFCSIFFLSFWRVKRLRAFCWFKMLLFCCCCFVSQLAWSFNSKRKNELYYLSLGFLCARDCLISLQK